MARLSQIYIKALLLLQLGCTIEHAEIYDGLFYYQTNDSTMLTVTPRLWNHGCTNTAIGMLVEYYDDLGYDLMDNLYDIVNIDHIEYYCYPIDSDILIRDSSEYLPNPPQTCLADYLMTSWSSQGCRYGATLWWNIELGLRAYVENRNPWYSVTAGNVWDFNHFTTIIDEGRPVFMLVDPKRTQEHSVLAIGYNRKNTSAYVLDTWNVQPREIPYRIRTATNIDSAWNIVGIMDLKICLK